MDPTSEKAPPAETPEQTITRLEAENAALKEENAALKELALTDDLTGLKNRRAILDDLNRELAKSPRANQKLAVIFIDVDNFKEVNDVYGHPQGDRVLQAVAKKLKEGTRATDLLGRFGGDEFLLLVPQDPNEPDTDITGVLQRHVKAAKTVNRSDEAGEFIEQTISLGCVIVPSGTNLDGNTVEEIKSQADQALYASKAAGESRFTITYYQENPILMSIAQPALTS